MSNPVDLSRNIQPDPLEAAPLAYENPEFLDSPDGRMLRIMAEYHEPMARFRRERIQDTVVFFGSARFRALDVANQRAGAAREHRLHAARARRKNSPPATMNWPAAKPPS